MDAIPKRDVPPLILTIEGDELAVLKAALANGLGEAEHTLGRASSGHRRLLALNRRVEALGGYSSVRLPLDRQDVALLRDSVTMVMARHGYVVGRPEAINALVSLRGKLDRLLRGSRWDEMRQAAGEILYGIFVYDGVRMLRKQEASLEHLFVLISFGGLLGVPVLPPYYTLRLLPFVVPLINGWRRRMLREKDLVDAFF